MPIFTASAAYIATSIGVSSAMGVAAINMGVRVLASYVVSRLIGNKSNNTGAGNTQDAGNRVQFPPATDNKLPVVYGSAFISPSIIDAKMSSDNKTMWYVMALSEVTDTGTISFGRQWWGDKELFFDSVDKTKVAYWINGNDQSNTNVAGNLYVYYYNDGSNSPVNTTLSAIDVLSDPSIEPDQRWTANHLMSKTAFAIVKMNYNQDANMTGLEQFKVQVENSLNKPGSVIGDYLTNNRYGCAIPIDNIDLTALTTLDTYSDEMIPYIDVNGNPATQPRYRINGPVVTTSSCLNNLQQLVDSCDSWLQWNELYGKWSVVINQSYLDYTTYDDLFVINDYNIVGGIDVTPVDLNSTYNSIESQYPNAKIKDQSDYTYVEVDMVDRNPNEPDNQLKMQLSFVNNVVQAKYLATRRLIQSREDLIINFAMDYSGIQIEAGDVVRVRHPVYGWGPLPDVPSNPDKLFRVNQVVESKTSDGSLGARLTLVEYNNQVYENIDIHDFTPSLNTGIPDPGWISSPGTPIVADGTPVDSDISSFKVSATVPATGAVLYMDFYYGTSADPSTHRLYKTVTPATGRQFVNNDTVTISVNDLPKGTYYWSVKARSSTSINSASANSDPSAPSAWEGAKYLVPLMVGGQLLGGIATDMLKPSTVKDLGGGYEKGVFYRPIVPVNVTSTSQRNRPLIYSGVSVSSTQIFPWYQGTAPGSTGPWLPSSSRAIPVNEGDDGWYKLIYWDTSVDKILTDEMGRVNLGIYYISDTPDTVFQIVNYLIFEGQTTLTLETNTLGTYTNGSLVDPYPVGLAINDTGSGSESIIEWGYAIRNMTVGSDLTVFGGWGVLKQLPLNQQSVP